MEANVGSYKKGRQTDVRLPFSTINHNLNNLGIRFLHTVVAEEGNVLDGFFDVAADKTVTAKELAILVEHFKSHDACVNRHRDLSGAACLRSVAHDTA